jgi:hypothetical protein
LQTFKRIYKQKNKRRILHMPKETYNYKRKAITAAKDLGYKPYVIEKLKAATKESDIERIMATARKETL